VPADDLTDPAPPRPIRTWTRPPPVARRVRQGIFPAIDPLDSHLAHSRPVVVGEEHYRVAAAPRKSSANTRRLKDIIAFWHGRAVGRRQASARARKIEKFLSQPMHRGRAFTNLPGIFVSLEDTIRSFKAVCDGEYDTCRNRPSTMSAPSTTGGQGEKMPRGLRGGGKAPLLPGLAGTRTVQRRGRPGRRVGTRATSGSCPATRRS